MKDSTILENSAKPKGAPMTPALESDCPTAMIRALGEFLAPGLPFKVRAPRIVRAIRARLPEGFSFTARRARAIHNSEARLVDWRERDAIRDALAEQEAAREFREFQAATNRALAALAASGSPLSGDAIVAIRAIEKRLADDRRAYRARSGGTAGAPDRAGIGHGGGRL